MVIFDTVTKKYKDNIIALEDITFRIDPGEFLFLVGPSGAGKSTIMRLLIREELPTSGTIFFNEIEVPKLTRRLLPAYRQKIGMVFQDIKLLNTKTLEENIEFALEILNKSQKEIEDTTDYLLDLVDLRDRRELFPYELSGGEQQRGAIARALANKPDFLVADEPTGNLDSENAMQILEILKTINKGGTTVMVISHDFNLLNGSNKDRTITLEEGKLSFDSDPREMTSDKEETEENTISSKVKSKKKTLPLSPEFNKLSPSLKKKLVQYALTSPEILINITTRELEDMKLSKKENTELAKFVKQYLSSIENE
ncbi:ATP-binding cassette domain-containing protein [Candidatus Dojkabacteria bacterium]|uniref:ATP-binding cassette domain-containing protein n=1 Tax=Candidatus Dojkabacteria bacterium TaxID=2099670 RepID=A0A847VD52_9BACT|nr:ATP-binding cassette domain-containing protein [Candidatus Dojkabacteria bacterium]